MITMMDVRTEGLDSSSGKETVYNDVALSGLFCPTSFSGGGFRSSLYLPILLWIGSDYQPRRGVLSGEMRVSIAPNRDDRRKGIEGNDERCNIGSHVLPSFPRHVLPTLPLERAFLGLTYGLTGLLHFASRSSAISTPEIGFSCERTVKRNARKGILPFIPFPKRRLSNLLARNSLHVCDPNANPRIN